MCSFMDSRKRVWDQPCFDGNWLTIVEKIKQLKREGWDCCIRGGRHELGAALKICVRVPNGTAEYFKMRVHLVSL